MCQYYALYTSFSKWRRLCFPSPLSLLDNIMLSLDELLLFTISLALDAFGQYLVGFNNSLNSGGLIFFYLDAIGFLLDFDLFLHLSLCNESLRKGFEVRCE